MVRYALLVEYNGSSYNGWQTQHGVPTIQSSLEAALSDFADEEINTITAGRTDSGVHALGQVVHFDTNAKRKLHGWVTAVNSKLPHGIRVKQATIVDDKFDARFSARKREYHYYLSMRATHSALLDNLVGHYPHGLDIELMQEAVQSLIGVHDFSSFRASDCQARNAVRTMHKARLERRGDMVRFEFTANAFLYHMVRNMVGALIYVGNKRIGMAQFNDLLNHKDRKLAPPTFMPDGLYLVNVGYEENIFPEHKFDSWLYNL